MALIGKSSFVGGRTLRQRVFAEEKAVLEECSGYEATLGYLRPEKLASKLNSNGELGATVPEQVPAAFTYGEDTYVICRDANEAMREFEGTAWGSAGAVCDVLKESPPVRLDRQIIIPTGGPNPRLMAYEPLSATTKLRPLSLKGPADYATGAKAVVTPATDPSTRLHAYDVAHPWTAGGGYATITDAQGKVIIVLSHATPPVTKVATKALTGATKDLGLPNQKCFLVLDVIIQGDEQLYPTLGLFANDAGMYASGYLIGLYSDAACTTLIAAYRLPKLPTQGMVHRVAINLGTQTATVAGITLETDSFYEPPATGKTATITMYCEPAQTDWSHKSNLLLPAVRWNKSAWADILAGLLVLDRETILLPPSANLITNPGFEDGTTGWTYGGGASLKNAISHGGQSCMELDWDGEWLKQSAIPLSPGRDARLEMWVYAPVEAARGWHLELTYKKADTSIISTLRLPDSGSYTFHNATYEKREWQIVAPALTATVDLYLYKDTGGNGNWRVDDVALYYANQGTAGSAAILQTMNEDTTQRTPTNPLARWAYCLAGKNLLSAPLYALMVSNPSDDNASNTLIDPCTFADPWRTYTIAVTLPGGPITALAVNAGGTGYVVNDILLIDGGEGGKAKVLTVAATVVTSVELLLGGKGYTSATGATTSGGTGTGCTLNTTAIQATTEYGDYLTHILIYRQIYYPLPSAIEEILGVWGMYQFVQAVEIGASTSWDDAGNDADPSLGILEVPLELEITNDYASSARYVMISQGRVYAFCLNWDNENGVWQRRTAAEVSSQYKPWAFPTTTDAESPITEGSELDGYAVTGSETRGLLSRNEEQFVWLENEVFLLRGENPINGWRFARLDSVGCISARSVADCREMIVWHDGNHFWGYGGGVSVCLSQFEIDSTLIDWGVAHGAVSWSNQYIFFCRYNSKWAALIYDVVGKGWRIRYSDAWNVVGICTSGVAVYGVNPAGDCVNPFGSTGADYGAAGGVTKREVFTQYLDFLNFEDDMLIEEGVFEIVTDQASISLDLTVRAQGVVCASVDRTLVVGSAKTRYRRHLNLHGNAAKVELTYTGTTPPDIHMMGVTVGGPARP